MPMVPLDTLPDDARVWIFSAERPLTAAEQAVLLEDVDAFLAAWAAHGQPLRAARDLRYDRFLIVAVDEASAGVSGCSIDALTRQLRDHESRLGIALLDNAPVYYRAPDGIARVSRAAFGDLADAGTVTPETTVFDNTVPDLGAVRGGRWESAAAGTWHGRAFFGLPRAP